ncbi:MAG TPA: rod shape-determining protein MreD [Pirellulales bacterium]|jgi:rod shape-determining protein MreD|nr:rod shape-determining protein MreD [Pirellulales bacterium]
MAVIFLILATYIAAVLQTTLVPAFEVRHVMPDLLSLVAIVWQLLTGWRRGFVATAMVGLAFDLTSTGLLGVGLGLFALVGFAVAWLRTKLDMNHLIVRLAVVWLATTAIAIGEVVICRLLGETTLPWPSLAVRAVGVGVYTTGVALPLLMVVGWLGEGRRQGARVKG